MDEAIIIVIENDLSFNVRCCKGHSLIGMLLQYDSELCLTF